MRMSAKKTYKFVQLYKSWPCLWDSTSVLYKNRPARANAYRAISFSLELEGFGPRDVPAKIRSLRSTYLQEVKKINESNKTATSEDMVYKPTIPWFRVAENIMGKSKDPLAEVCVVEGDLSEDISISSSNEGESEDQDMQGSFQDQARAGDEVLTHIIHAKKEDNSEENILLVDKSSLNCNGASDEIAQSETNANGVATIINPTKQWMKIHTKSGNKLKVNSLDEFDIFGRYIASQLRQMPIEKALEHQMAIQRQICESRLQIIKSCRQSLSIEDAAS